MPQTKTSRKDILRACWQVFHEYGYYDASLQKLAGAAGLGKAGLLHHFGSKAGVMRATLDFAIDWYERKILVLLHGDEPLQARFGAFMDAHFRFCAYNNGAGCFFANTILETGVTGQFSDALEQFHTKWKAATETLLRERFDEAEARERTYRIFADYQGSVMLYKLYRDDSHLLRLKKRTLQSFDIPLYPPA